MSDSMPNSVLPVTMVNSKLDSLAFELPSHLEAGEPPEARRPQPGCRSTDGVAAKR